MRGLGNRLPLSLEPGRISESVTATLSSEEQEGVHSHPAVFEKCAPLRGHLTSPTGRSGDGRNSKGPGQTLTKLEVNQTALGRREWVGTERSRE